MAQNTTVLDQFLRLIPAGLFDSLVARCNADKGARCMTARAQFATLAFAQAGGGGDGETRHDRKTGDQEQRC